MIIFLSLFMNQCQKTKDLEMEFTNLQNWNDTTNLILNQQYARNAVLETSKKSTFLDIKNLQGDKLALQNLVKRERNTSAALRSRIAILLKGNTTDVTIEYSAADGSGERSNTWRTSNDSGQFFPIYSGTVTEEPWWTARCRASNTAIEVEMDVQATFSYTWQYKRSNGFFSVKEPIVSAEVDNPYVAFTSIESWSEKPKPPRLSWSVTAGIGMSTELKPVLGIIVGPSYRIRDW